ncbi:MAG: TIGR02996 domain-containing protein [Myxococcales bacterium]|nr:TIGR02996 domain-containing protein [Myxococcales bacterium]
MPSLSDQERALLQAVADAPEGERDAAQVYADWLSQQGDRRGVLIAMQLRIGDELQRRPTLDTFRQQQSAARMLAENACEALADDADIVGLDAPLEPPTSSPWLDELPARSASFVDGFTRYPLIVERDELERTGDALLRYSPKLVVVDSDAAPRLALEGGPLYDARSLTPDGSSRALWLRRIRDDWEWTEELSARALINRALLEELAIHQAHDLAGVGFVPPLAPAARASELALLYQPSSVVDLAAWLSHSGPTTQQRVSVAADVAFANAALETIDLEPGTHAEQILVDTASGDARLLGLARGEFPPRSSAEMIAELLEQTIDAPLAPELRAVVEAAQAGAPCSELHRALRAYLDR